MTSSRSAASHPRPATNALPVEGVMDCVDFSNAQAKPVRVLWMALALGAGTFAGHALSSRLGQVDVLWAAFLSFVFLGGLLSTWSPCGYSCLSLLRPAGTYGFKSVSRWIPTFFTHAVGYALGAVLLAGILGGAGYLMSSVVPVSLGLTVLAVLSIAYGVHQFDFLKMPYPQRRAQVPHDARFRFSSPVIGILYGFALGMNYLTYVQTPILYIVTGAAFLSGNVGTALLIIGVFNIGRFLPMVVNFLPVHDSTVQAWLARWQERAVTLDGCLLLMAGAAVLTMVVV